LRIEDRALNIEDEDRGRWIEKVGQASRLPTGGTPVPPFGSFSPRSSFFIFRPEEGKALNRENGERSHALSRFPCFDGLKEKTEKRGKWERKEGREETADRAWPRLFSSDCCRDNSLGNKICGKPSARLGVIE
jgi:hypothetical protein